MWSIFLPCQSFTKDCFVLGWMHGSVDGMCNLYSYMETRYSRIGLDVHFAFVYTLVKVSMIKYRNTKNQFWTHSKWSDLGYLIDGNLLNFDFRILIFRFSFRFSCAFFSTDLFSWFGLSLSKVISDDEDDDEDDAYVYAYNLCLILNFHCNAIIIVCIGFVCVLCVDACQCQCVHCTRNIYLNIPMFYLTFFSFFLPTRNLLLVQHPTLVLSFIFHFHIAEMPLFLLAI